MKKLIILLALTFVMCGCVTKNEDGSYPIGASTGNPQVVVIESCEYIRWGHGLTHKGNCKFCAERRKKEQEELIRRLKEE